MTSRSIRPFRAALAATLLLLVAAIPADAAIKRVKSGKPAPAGAPQSAPQSAPSSAPETVPVPATPPPVQLIETRPVETALGNLALPTALDAWLKLIREARSTIDMEEFYLSTWPGEPMDEVMSALGNAAKRGVKLRLILDSGMARTYPRGADSLSKVSGWEVKLIDFRRVAGGIQHSKYFIVDGEIAVLGSQNFDWRALKHIHELGVVVRDRRVAADFQQVFDMDWNVSRAPGAPPDTTRHQYVAPPRHPSLPLPYAIAQAPGDTLLLWPSWTPARFCPDTSMWDLRSIVRLLDGAKREVGVQVLQYGTAGRGDTLTDIDDALRRAAARGVKVRMVISDWVLGGSGLKNLQSLATLPNVEIRISTLPEWSGGYIPFARVEHCKYMVVDDDWTWVGTDNWEPGYFLGTRNLAVTIRHAGTARDAHAIFEASWNAPSAHPLDPNGTYSPKVRGEDPPPGHTKYGG